MDRMADYWTKGIDKCGFKVIKYHFNDNDNFWGRNQDRLLNKRVR